MAANRPGGSNNTLYFIVGALVIAVLIIGYFMYGGDETPDDVDVDVTHEWVGDLRVRVIAPNATAVTLVDRPVNAGDCGSDDIDTSFSDGGALFPCAPTIPASGTAPVAPVTPLSSLLSGPVAGAWSLEITDFANSGIGALEDWAVTFTCGTTPTVTVATVDGTGNEAGDPIVFRVTRSVVSVTPLTVFLTLSGSAGPADYQAVTLPVTIPGGAGFVDVTIVPVEDIVPEPAETVIVTVNAGAGYIVGSPDAASATIEADPIAVPLLDPLGMAITIVLLAMAGFVALSRIRM